MTIFREMPHQVWTEEIEKQLQYIGNCCRGHIWMYKREIQKIAKVNFWIKTIGISSSSLSGALAIISTVLDSTTFAAVLAIFSFISAISQGFLSQTKYEETINSFKNLIASYGGIADNIRRQLIQPRFQRERAIDYHRWISSGYDQILQNSLTISESTVEEYRLICAANQLPFPEDTDHGGIITIYKNTSDEKENPSETNDHSATDLGRPPPEENVEKVPEIFGANVARFADDYMKYELSRFEQQ